MLNPGWNGSCSCIPVLCREAVQRHQPLQRNHQRQNDQNVWNILGPLCRLASGSHPNPLWFDHFDLKIYVMASAVYQSIKSISGYIRQIVSGTKRRAPLGTMDVTVEVMTSVRKQCLAPRISKAWLEKELSKDVQRCPKASSKIQHQVFAGVRHVGSWIIWYIEGFGKFLGRVMSQAPGSKMESDHFSTSQTGCLTCKLKCNCIWDLGSDWKISLYSKWEKGWKRWIMSCTHCTFWKDPTINSQAMTLPINDHLISLPLLKSSSASNTEAGKGWKRVKLFQRLVPRLHVSLCVHGTESSLGCSVAAHAAPWKSMVSWRCTWCTGLQDKSDPSSSRIHSNFLDFVHFCSTLFYCFCHFLSHLSPYLQVAKIRCISAAMSTSWASACGRPTSWNPTGTLHSRGSPTLLAECSKHDAGVNASHGLCSCGTSRSPQGMLTDGSCAKILKCGQ